jgi:hypothetical protein
MSLCSLGRHFVFLCGPLGLCLTLCLALAPHPAQAHTRSQSFSSWEIDKNQVKFGFWVSAQEVTRLPPVEGAAGTLEDLLVRHLLSRVAVTWGETLCEIVDGPRALQADDEGYIRVEALFRCPPTDPAPRDYKIENQTFFEVAPSHVHFARVTWDNKLIGEYLFTDTQQVQTVTLPKMGEKVKPVGTTFLGYIRLGIEHIMGGVDHLCFLLGLILLSRRLRDVVFVVTGFTLGHSVTLSLAVLGIVEPNTSVVEALIGFTIALVAAENIGVTTGTHRQLAVTAGGALVALLLLKLITSAGLPITVLMGVSSFTVAYLLITDTPARAMQYRPIVTAVFGLVHGFGFARVLTDAGLPQERIIPALLGFNVGVEIGQIAIVAALWGVGLLAVRFLRAEQKLEALHMISAGLCAVGVFWFIERAY